MFDYHNTYLYQPPQSTKMSSVEEIIFTEEDKTLVVDFMNLNYATFKLADTGDVYALSMLCSLIRGLSNRTVADLADSDARDMLDLVQKLKNRYHAGGTWITDLEENLIATISLGIRQRTDLEVEVNRIKSEVERIKKHKDALKLSLKRKKNALEEAINKRASFDVHRAKFQSRVLLPFDVFGGHVAGNITSAGQLPPGFSFGTFAPVPSTVQNVGRGSYESGGESHASGGVGSDGGRGIGRGSQKSGAGGGGGVNDKVAISDGAISIPSNQSDGSCVGTSADLSDHAVSANVTEAAGGAGDHPAPVRSGGDKGDGAPILGLRL